MWHVVDIAGKSADVFELSADVRPRFAALFLHDLEEETLARSPVFTRLLEQHQLACVCPHGRRSWWTNKVCAEFDPALTAEAHVLKNVLPFLQQRWGLAPRSTGLFGIGMGGQGALRLAFKHPRTFPVVAGISSALDCHEIHGQGTPLDAMYDSPEQCRQDTALLHLHPTQFPSHIFFCIDPDDTLWYRGNDRLHEKLTALGIPHQCDFTTRAGGHSWDYYQNRAPRVLQFIRDGLLEESRRLL